MAGSVHSQLELFKAGQLALFFSELVVIALVVGFAKHSWYWGGGTMASLTIALAFGPLRVLLALCLCLLWGALGYFLGFAAFKEVPASVVCCGVAFVISVGCHWAALAGLDELHG